MNLLQHLRSSLRLLVRNPGTTGLALLTLALGIGASTSIFSVIQGVLLKPLPYPDPGRLALVWETNPAEGATEIPVAALNLKSWQDENHVFKSLVAIQENRFSLTGVQEAAIVPGALVSGDFFRTLGVSPGLGRGFSAEDDLPGRPGVAVLGYGIWQRRFGRDPGVIGHGITLDGKLYTVVGVMPDGFEMPQGSQLWVPIGIDFAKATRNAHELTVVGRLNPGGGRERAQTEMAAIAAQLAAAHPESNKGRSVQVVSLQESVVSNVRPALMVLLVAVGFLLLIACVNVANLLLSRVVDREREIALRSALGADRGEVVRQMLVESSVLFLLSGLLGLLLAYWGTRVLVRIDPNAVPRSQEIGFNVWVLGFAILISLITGLIVGLVPAFNALSRQLYVALKEGGRGLGGGTRGRLVRDLLVGAEVALALVLLLGAALLIQSFSRLRSVDPGFSPRGVLSMNLLLTAQKYDDSDRLARFYQEILDSVAAVPGVDRVASVFPLPFAPNDLELVFNVEGRTAATAADSQISTKVRVVSPAYFELLQIPLVKGRAFTAQDNLKAPGVVIVNQKLAKQMWPNGDALGKRMTFGPPTPDAHWVTVVGIVGDTRSTALNQAPVLEAYRSVFQKPFGIASLLVKGKGNPALLARPAMRQVQSLDRDLPIDRVLPFEDVVAATLAQSRFKSVLLGTFAALALCLAAIGIYGVINYSVSQRTHEIGIRMALGADRGQVMRLILGQGMKMVVYGLVAGILIAYFVVRFLSSQLYEVKTGDLQTFALVPLVLAGVASLANFLPARRAMRVEPLEALRNE